MHTAIGYLNNLRHTNVGFQNNRKQKNVTDIDTTDVYFKGAPGKQPKSPMYKATFKIESNSEKADQAENHDMGETKVTPWYQKNKSGRKDSSFHAKTDSHVLYNDVDGKTLAMKGVGGTRLKQHHQAGRNGQS